MKGDLIAVFYRPALSSINKKANHHFKAIPCEAVGGVWFL